MDAAIPQLCPSRSVAGCPAWGPTSHRQVRPNPALTPSAPASGTPPYTGEDVPNVPRMVSPPKLPPNCFCPTCGCHTATLLLSATRDYEHSLHCPRVLKRYLTREELLCQHETPGLRTRVRTGWKSQPYPYHRVRSEAANKRLCPNSRADSLPSNSP